MSAHPPTDVFNPKVKSVSFRLSLEDYSSFQQACEAYGFSTVSEFARRAMQHFIEERSTAARDLEVRGLRERVERLAREVSRLTRARCTEKPSA